MSKPSDRWVLLVYRIPAHPTRLRLAIWRTLQRMGALSLQNAVFLLPARPDLIENMHYIAGTIEEMGGSCHLFSSSQILPGGDERLVGEFRALADERYAGIAERLDRIEKADAAKAEEEMKRERTAFLRAKRLAYFGGAQEEAVEARLEMLKHALDARAGMEK